MTRLRFFADIVAYSPNRYRGIIALRGHNHPEVLPHLMTRLQAYLLRYPTIKHYRGALLVIEAHRIRT